MKRQLVIVGITLVLLAVGLSGCTNDNKSSSTPNGNTGTNETWTPGETDKGSYEEAIIGQWSVRTETLDTEQYIFNFYTNQSFKWTDTSTQYTSWGTYGMFPGITLYNSDGRIHIDGFLYTTDEYYWNDKNNTLKIEDYKATYIFTRKGTNGGTGTNGDTGTFNEKIVGKWWATSPSEEGTSQFYFYANGSYNFIYPNGRSMWDTYTMIDNILTVQATGYSCECIFSDNDNKVTVYYNGKVNTVLTRQ